MWLKILEFLDVSRSCYHKWISCDPSGRTLANYELDTAIPRIDKASRQTYGSPRMRDVLVSEGLNCSPTRVERRMKATRIRAKAKLKFRVSTDSQHSRPVSANIIDRDFKPAEPDKVWLTDITYIATGEGWLYLATVTDAYFRKVVGR
ncbi:MAG: hypothetical protein EOP10_13695 [Proteobacteria bacterium]|nr:MAG: hypothetical protein EOP10_13695 [Pseudomonadota bacterium]